MSHWTQAEYDAHQAKIHKGKQPEQEGSAMDSFQVKSKPRKRVTKKEQEGLLSPEIENMTKIPRNQPESRLWISRYDIIPMGKPRITSRGKYGPIARRYYEYAERIRTLNMVIPESGVKIQFFMPMPKSWSKKKKREFRHNPHQQTPDIDNLLKAVLDAVYEDDKVVWSIKAEKFWAINGFILIITK